MVDFYIVVKFFVLRRKVIRCWRSKCYLYFFNLKGIFLLREIFIVLGGYYIELFGRFFLYSDLMIEIVDGLEREVREILYSFKYR